MDIHSDKEPALPIFRLFTPRATSKENGNINKTTENVTALSSSQLNNFDDCSQLPDGLKKCVPTELIGRPLDDPFCGNKETFIVINKNHQLFRFSSTNALGIFSPTSAIRSNAIRILTHPFYAVFMVLVILAFCIINAIVPASDFDLRYFLIIFLLEILLKLAAHGLVLSPFSYVRNVCNILDVVLNVLLLCGTFYLAELRILSIISYSLNLRQTIRLYWSSCKLLKDLIIYMGVMLAILSMFFLQIYMGTLTQTCVEDGKQNEEVRFCGNMSGSQQCPDSSVCMQRMAPNPDFGYTNFDSIFGSLLSTFRLITRDFWENLLQIVLATSGPWHIVSFIVIIFIISYQVLSLIWGQIAMSYNYVRVQRWEQNLIAEDVDEEDETSQEGNDDKEAGCWSKFQRTCFFIIYNPFVVLFVIICIVLNTLCMALDHHNMVRDLERVLSYANYTFVLIFVVEATLKLLALGVVRYFKDVWNTFDFVVTVLGAVELLLEGVQGLSVFRSFRLLRPLRLGKIVPAFDLILTRFQHLFSVVSGQTIIFFMGIYIFTVFGCHQFGDDFKAFNYDPADTDTPPLWRFDDIMHSFMVVFRAQCGEWIETMFICLEVTSTAINSITCVMYYFLLVTISSFQIMHIFTALLFTNDDSTAISTKNQALKATTKPKESFHLVQFLKDKLLEPSVKRIYDEYKRPKGNVEATGESSSAKMVTKAVIEDDFDDATNKTDTSIPIEPTPTNVEEIALENNQNKYLTHGVTLCVIAASITLAMGYDTDANSNHTVKMISIYLEFIFIGLLSIELMAKLIGRGWKLCVTDFWYWVDLFNIIIAVFGIFTHGTAIAILSSLRPLSLVSRCHGLKVIANAILKQMWFLTNTLLVCSAFWLIFAIMGVQLFGGKFYNCFDHDGNNVETVNITDCLQREDTYYVWQNSFMSFDDVIDSYFSLLQVSTFKGWISIINDAVDSTSVNELPVKEENIYMFFYFVIFVACGVFVCVNVIIGMLVQHMIHFGSLSELLDRSKTKSRKSDESLDKDETPETNPSNSKFVNFVRSRAFEMIAFGSYVVYVIVLMCDTANSSVSTSTALEYVHILLVILLTIEVILRACAYRKEFLVSSWNRFDVVVIIFMLTDFIAMEVGLEKYFLSAFIFRVIRIFRFNGLIASFSQTLQRCGKIIARTWKTVSMLYALLFLIICVYAIIGTVLYKDKTIVFGSIDILNFKTFGQSLILMIQLSTAAGWDGVLAQISTENRGVATLYLLSFLYISFTILLNVMLVIAFEFYKEVTSIEDERRQLQPDDLNDFNEKWKQYAQNDRRYVPKNRLSNFLNSLDESSSLRPVEYNEDDFALLGVNTRKDDNYSRSALLIALNRIRLNKQQ